MNNLIGKEVFVEARDKSGYYYSADDEWKKGKIVGVFIEGDVLIECDESYIQEHQNSIAFTKDADVPPVMSVKMEELPAPSKESKDD